MFFNTHKQNLIMFSNKFSKEKMYWDKKINEILENSFADDTVDYDYRKKEFHIKGEMFESINKICNKSPLACYIMFTSIFQYILSIYNNNNKIHVLSPILKSNEKIKEINNCVLINAEINMEDTFKRLLSNVSKEVSISYKLSNYPVVRVIEESGNGNGNIGKYIVSCKNIHEDIKIENLQMQLDIDIKEDEIVLELLCNKDKSIINVLEHINNVLKQIISNVDIKLSDFVILPKEEMDLIEKFNLSKVDYPKDKSIQELFEEQVNKTPDNIALVFNEEKLTYNELNKKANSLARALVDMGVGSKSIVALMGEKSLEAIIAIVAILKAGGAYLPISPEYPDDRINDMLDDSGTNLLLTINSVSSGIEFNGSIVDLCDSRLYQNNQENLNKECKSSDLAYIIYTSGSTGKPKGAMVEHRGVVRLVKNTNYITLTSKDRILQAASMAFDASIFEIWGALLNGSELHIVSKNLILNPEKLGEVINKSHITIILLTTALFNLLSEYNPLIFENVKYLLIGGEALLPNNINLVRDKVKTIKIINAYGPTENAVLSTTFEVDKNYSKNIPIGKTINNSTVYILGENNEIKPIGVIGELCVGGDGVARGYLNRPELTNEKFINDPFKGEGKLYKTGDLGRWLPDGNIEFIGRKDNQVKIRGFRIELGEIEERLVDNTKVKNAVVIDKIDKSGNKYLCAYLVTDEDIIVKELKKELSISLPDYMIPTHFMFLDKIPITSNGKVDRKALPEPIEIMSTDSKYEAPRNHIEKQLENIWKEILGIEKAGINDDFFELGGHSLKAAVLASKIHKTLSVEVPIREIFDNPTIKGIGECIEKREKSAFREIKKVDKKEFYEASSEQKRIYMLQQFDLESTSYNMPCSLEVKGSLNLYKLEEALKKLIDRHEILRTSFETKDDMIIQKVHENVNFKIEDIKDDFIRTFDLSKAPLLRVGVKKIEEDRFKIMYDVHHIIADGISMKILIDEFIKIYEGNKLDDLNIQYKDYSEWKKHYKKSDEYKKQEDYWLKLFDNNIPVLDMSTDFIRPSKQSFEGDSLSIDLGVDLTSKLNKLAKDTSSTIYMVLLSAINILLSKYSGQQDIVVGSPIAGRLHSDLDRLIGMFVNTLLMRCYPSGEKSYKEFLKEVKDSSIKAFENQDYPFEELVDKLNITRDISRNALFDVMFSMENIEATEIGIEGLSFKIKDQENKVCKFDLSFTAKEVNNDLIIKLEYCKALFKEETISKMLNHLRKILEIISLNIDIKLCDIDMMSVEERKELQSFNDTKVNYLEDRTLQELFEEQVKKTPEKIALVFQEKEMTYKELNEKSNSLARVLRERGVKADSIVGIMIENSLEMIIGILAILKSGAAYLPISPSYPKERIKYMLDDSKAQILLTRKKLLNIDEYNGVVISFDDEIYNKSTANLEKINCADNLAYIIYTSGTTGKPKGVMINHKSVLNTLFFLERKYKLTSEGAYLLKTNYCFDVSVTEIFSWFIGGGKLVILKAGYEKSPEKIFNEILRTGVTHINFTSSMFNIFSNYLYRNKIKNLGSLRYILTAGEKLKIENHQFANELLKSISIENLYGPTEASIYATSYSVKKVDGSTIYIGKPLDNDGVYILDKYNKLLPIGIKGEIYLSGAGLARGYINNEKLTNERFIDNPLSPGEKIYKTGDLGRWTCDGNIECLGRIDKQVKVRGFRIELEEIEVQLLNYKKVKDAVVLVKKDEEDDDIYAYLVSDSEITVKEIRKYLSEKLPEYMIPSNFVKVDEIPLTSNGKVDTRKLLNIGRTIKTGVKYEAPRNGIEIRLAEIWSEVLKISKVGIKDDFIDLGGNSLKSVILADKISKALGVSIGIADVLKYNSIAKMAEFISSIDSDLSCKYENVKIIKNNGSKKNVFFIHDGSGDISAYIQLVNRLQDDFNYFGIDASDISTGFPINTYVEELAERYTKYILEVQKEGPYFIAGGSLGGAIAFEISRKLEKEGKTVEKLIIIDSYIATDFETKGIFEVEGEKRFLSDLLNIKIEKQYESMESLYKELEELISNIDVKEMGRRFKEDQLYRLVPKWDDFEGLEAMKKLNVIRTLIRANNDFYPKGKVKCSIDFIKAISSVRTDEKVWNELSINSIKYTNINGNHYSIFTEDIEGLIDAVRKILMK